MFGLGMMEIGLIIALAVMLFPPKELPKLARSIARIYGQVRKTAEDFRSAVLDDEDLRAPIDEIKGAYNDARWEVRDAERKARQQLAKAQMELRMATARRLQDEREQQAKTAAKTADEQGAKSGKSAEGAGGGSAASASAASPVRIAAGEPDDDADAGEPAQAFGATPVSANDPRTIAARRPPPYTPPTSSISSISSISATPADDGGEPNDSGEPREGVA